MFTSSGAPSFFYSKSTLNELFTTQPLTLNMRQTIEVFSSEESSLFFRKHIKENKFIEILDSFGVAKALRKDYESFLVACVNCFKCFIDNDEPIAHDFSYFYQEVLNDDEVLSNQNPTNDEIDLVLELDKKCPICGKPLILLEEERYVKNFCITQIYPDDLEDMQKMMFDTISPEPSDFNNLDNLIALCPEHYLDYKKNHDIDTFEKLLEVKKLALENKKTKQKISNIDMSDNLKDVIDRLFAISDTSALAELKYSALRIDEKIPRTLAVTYESVENKVIKYYHFIDTYLRSKEIKTDGKATTLSQQIKAISDTYIAAGKTIREVLNQITYDLVDKLGGDAANLEACAIVVAYFVQHCEVLSK